MISVCRVILRIRSILVGVLCVSNDKKYSDIGSKQCDVEKKDQIEAANLLGIKDHLLVVITIILCFVEKWIQNSMVVFLFRCTVLRVTVLRVKASEPFTDSRFFISVSCTNNKVMRMYIMMK